MMIKKRLGLIGPPLLAAALWLALCAPPASALQVPALKGRINDYAGLLSSGTAQQLEAALAELERTDSTQIVVLTIPSLEGDSLEDFSIRVAEQWQIGQKGKDNGALLLVAKNDRKIRIEAGYGLEGKLTDLVSGRIIRNVMVPQFKMGRFDQGIIDGVAAMVGVVRGEYTAPATAERRSGRQGASPGLVGLVALIFFINMLGRLNRGLGAAGGGVLAPIAGALFLNLGLFGILSLIPLGAAAGFMMGGMGGPVSFGRTAYHRRSGGFWGGGFGGGGFGGGGFGGFSGGGGGFGGGGASGGW
jgi:uncharacterized protein